MLTPDQIAQSFATSTDVLTAVSEQDLFSLEQLVAAMIRQDRFSQAEIATRKIDRRRAVLAKQARDTSRGTLTTTYAGADKMCADELGRMASELRQVDVEPPLEPVVPVKSTGGKETWQAIGDKL